MEKPAFGASTSGPIVASISRMLNGILTPNFSRKIPGSALQSLRQHGITPTRFILTVSVAKQQMLLFELTRTSFARPQYEFRRSFLVSTSSYGTGQVMNSNQTPLGLHRIARKVGAGQPVGTVFRSREAVGLRWQGKADATIVHRILWLEGLAPGFNRGGKVDTFQRYIYIHGFGDEMTLGRPKSHGCIHMAAEDLMPLFDRLPVGTLVWIAER